MLYLSASAMGNYKDCPTLYKLPKIDRVYPGTEATPLRMGTNWHDIQHVFRDIDDRDDVQQALIDHVDGLYAECPTHVSMEDWLVERSLFLYTAWAYFNHYDDSDVKVVASEMPFELTLLHPKAGRAMPNVRVRGILDKIIEYPDRGLFIREYKSTSDSVEDGSPFWPNLRMALQPSIYYDAAKRMGYDIQGIEYDVWHKPTIKPKFLTQKDTKDFIESGRYLDQEIEDVNINAEEMTGMVGNEHVEFKEGKQSNAIKETPLMYGIRLFEDIQERPEFYFNRKEIVRTAQDMEAFQWEMFSTYRTMKDMIKSGHWFKNEKNCERMGKCCYTPICYNHVDVSEHVPDGFYKKEKE